MTDLEADTDAKVGTRYRSKRWRLWKGRCQARRWRVNEEEDAKGIGTWRMKQWLTAATKGEMMLCVGEPKPGLKSYSCGFSKPPPALKSRKQKFLDFELPNAK
ncbi:hypothetical protein PIB30_074211 [Stylosanthes scabra]|uniref:Uncharacterized protein n=1 Tax=Stylosanthes scabra TaxID=79078 RepID=A0ABU6US35_9FABA|nr:hypothetical protein [Stylosanthes scabra]